jgi:hypothetical protein
MRKGVFLFVILLSFGVESARADDDLFGGFSADVRKVFKGEEVPWIPSASDIGFFGSYYSNGIEEGRYGFSGQYLLPSTPVSIGAIFEGRYLDWELHPQSEQYRAGPTLQLKFGDPHHWDVSLRAFPLFDLKEGDFGEVEALLSLFVGEMALTCNHHFEFLFRARYVYSKEDGYPLESVEDDEGELRLAQHEVSGEIEWSYHYRNFRYLQPLLSIGYTHLFSDEVLRVEVEPQDQPRIIRVWDTYYDQGILTLAGGLKSEIRLNDTATLFGRLSAGAQYIYSDPGDNFWRPLLLGDIGFWF